MTNRLKTKLDKLLLLKNKKAEQQFLRCLIDERLNTNLLKQLKEDLHLVSDLELDLPYLCSGQASYYRRRLRERMRLALSRCEELNLERNQAAKSLQSAIYSKNQLGAMKPVGKK